MNHIASVVIKSFPQRKHLFSLGLLLFAFVIVTYKTSYAFTDNHYLAYGLDSLRILGRAQELRYLGWISPYLTNRYGLITLIALVGSLFRLPPSQTLAPFLWIINLGGAVTVFFAGYSIFRRLQPASLSVFFYATLVSTLPVQVNDSMFFTLIVSPLRLAILFFFLDAKTSHRKTLLILTYFLFCLYSYLTYPILAALSDMLALALVFPLLYKSRLNSTQLFSVFLSQLLAFVGYFVFVQTRFRWSLPLAKFIEREFSTYILPPGFPSLAVLVTLLSLEGIIILLLLPITGFKITLPTPTTFKPFHSIISRLFRWAAYLVFLAAFLSLIDFILTSANIFVPFLNNITPSLSLAPFTSAWLSLVLIGSYLYFFPRFRLSLPQVTLVTCVVLYFLLIHTFTHPFVAVLRNERFVFYFQILLILTLPRLLLSFKRPLLLVVLLAASLFFAKLDLTRLSSRLYLIGNPPVLTAADWLVKQPDHTNVVFFPRYFRYPGIAEYEFPWGLYFSASKVNRDDQIRLARCQGTGPVCFNTMLAYARQHKIKYLVISDGTRPSTIAYARSKAPTLFQHKNIYILEVNQSAAHPDYSFYNLEK